MMTGELPALMQCRACGLFKPYEDFSKDARRPSGIKYQCKACVAAYAREWRQANLAARLEAEKRWREANRERAKETQRRYRKKNPEQVRDSRRRYRETHREKVNEMSREWHAANRKSARSSVWPKVRGTETYLKFRARYRASTRAAVFAHYGTACACCGSTSSLQIDHIEGMRNAPRGSPRSGASLYRWLVSRNFPPGFQTLCRACNRSKGEGPSCTLTH
jgi:hypothetical protein